MAEIAIAVPSSSSSLTGMPRSRPTTTMNATAVQAMMPSTRVRVSNSFCSGDRVRVTEVSMVAICPIWVSMPVPVTTIEAVPRVTDVFWNNMFDRSPERDIPRQHGAVLAHRCALPGQRGLLRLQRRRPDDPAVRRHDVTGLHLHQVAGHHLDRRHQHQPTAADDLGLRHLQVRQGVHARPGLQLLP